MTAITGAIVTLDDYQQNFSDFLNEDSPPSTADALYGRRKRWGSLGREDTANRWFWSFLKTSSTVAITSGNAGPYALPLTLTRSNALKYFKTRSGGVEFTDPYETAGNYLKITRDFTTGGYQITLSSTPTSSDTADIDYYGTPTPLSSGTDLLLVDGSAVLFFGLMMHFFAQGNLARMGELRNEYENRVAEITRQEAINAPGALTSSQNFEKARHLTSEKDFYSGVTRRGA